jgi:hypothetical protein
VNIRIELPPNNEWLPKAISRASRRSLLPIRIMAAVFGLLAVLLAVAGVADPTSFAPAAVFLAVAGFLLWAAWRAPRLAVRRQPRYMRTEPAVLEIGASGVIQRWVSARAHLDWPAFERVAETPDLWLLYLGPMHVMYVPKALLSEAERAELATWFADRGLDRRRPPVSQRSAAARG